MFHSKPIPLEWRLGRGGEAYVKVVCHAPDDMRVVGFHVLSPNAGEITQGIAVAMQAGPLYKRHLDATVGIHPTVAEEVTSLTVTKRSGASASKAGC